MNLRETVEPYSLPLHGRAGLTPFVFSQIQLVSSVRSSNSHPDLLVIHPLFQITPVLNTGLSLYYLMILKILLLNM